MEKAQFPFYMPPKYDNTMFFSVIASMPRTNQYRRNWIHVKIQYNNTWTETFYNRLEGFNLVSRMSGNASKSYYTANPPGGLFRGGFRHEAGLEMLIRPNDRRPSGRLIDTPFSYVTWLNGMRLLTWATDAQGNLCCPRGMAAPTDNAEELSFEAAWATCAPRTRTAASVEEKPVHDEGTERRRYMAELDRVISPAMAHQLCSRKYGYNNKLWEDLVGTKQWWMIEWWKRL